MPRFEIREPRSGEEAAILSAVEGAPSPALWRWRAGAPDGTHSRVAVDPEGRVLALVAGVVVRVQMGETRERWIAVDACLHDGSASGGLGKHLPLVALLRDFVAAVGGPGPERHPVLYGLPPPRVFRFSFHYGLDTRHRMRSGVPELDWEVVRDLSWLRLEAPFEEGLAGGRTNGVEVEEVEAFPDAIEDLFRRAAAAHGAIAVRDAAFLRWRFSEHPEKDYAVALARGAGGSIAGYAVYHLGEAESGTESEAKSEPKSGPKSEPKSEYGSRPEGLLCDWLVAPGEEGAAAALRAWAAGRAARDGVPLSILLSDNGPEWIAFQRAGFRLRPMEPFLAVRSFERRKDANQLYPIWTTTLADFPRF